MARGSERNGVATELVKQAASKSSDVASWLDQRDPGSLLDEVKGFARRKPGVFIGAAAVAGILAGRLTRSMTGDESGATHSRERAHSAPSNTSGQNAHSRVDDSGRSVPPPPVDEAPNPARTSSTAPQAESPYTAPDSGFVPPEAPRRNGGLS
ncbi:hypothetical protein [Paramicrobacterium agarici]|uniref:hypothetical protein n=1 Tax=Paramicrobacterium agarici TaxID=630514 RepID=UPI00115324E0|nr:hypothetical protein [Microbacterium agarici]